MNYAEMWARVRLVWAALVVLVFFIAMSVGFFSALDSTTLWRAGFGYGALAAGLALLPLLEDWPVSLRLLLLWVAISFCGATTKGEIDWEAMLVMPLVGLAAYGLWQGVLWIYSGLTKR